MVKNQHLWFFIMSNNIFSNPGNIAIREFEKKLYTKNDAKELYTVWKSIFRLMKTKEKREVFCFFLNIEFDNVLLVFDLKKKQQW